MTASPDRTVICTYRVRAGAEEAFARLLAEHWHVLDGQGLVQGEPSRFWRGVDETGGVFFVELFTWRTAEAPEAAHDSASVMAVWGPMGELCEARGGRPPMEFPHVAPFEPPARNA